MEAAQAADRERTGGAILRVLGVLMLLYGLSRVLGFVCLWADALAGLPFVSRPTDYTSLLGLWPVRGAWAYADQAAVTLLLLFAGVQLIRLRRSGWIAAGVVLLYVCLSVSLFILTDQAQKAIDAVQPPVYVAGVRIGSSDVAPQLERLHRHLWFWFTVHAVVLLVLLSEWRRFFGEPRRSSLGAQAAKVAVALVVIAVSAGWTFGGAEYIHNLKVFREARYGRPVLSRADFDRLSPARAREVAALLITRLTAEQTDTLAEAVDRTSALYHLQQLEAEDIPRIIKAAGAKSARVRSTCYAILGRIATAEAETCLQGALNGPRDEAWDAALTALVSMRPSKVPDLLLTLVEQESDEQEWLVRQLGNFRDERVRPVLLKLAAHAQDDVRGAAFAALRQHPGDETEPALQAALHDRELWVRGVACYSLGGIGTTSSIGLLIEVIKEREDEYRYPHVAGKRSLHEDAAFALATITGQPYDMGPERWGKWWRDEGPAFDLKKNLVKRLFTPLPPSPTEPPKSPDEFDREPHRSYMRVFSLQANALKAIGQRNMRELAPDVARYMLLPDDQAAVKFLAAEILASWRCREGSEWLIEHLDEVSNVAIPILGRATGVNFFGNRTRWQAWWEEHRGDFPSAEGTAPGDRR